MKTTEKVIKKKTVDMLNVHVSNWKDDWTFTIVNTAINDANGDYEQLRSDLGGASDMLKRVVHAIASRRSEIVEQITE